jgi:hypothetical protein
MIMRNYYNYQASNAMEGNENINHTDVIENNNIDTDEHNYTNDKNTEIVSNNVNTNNRNLPFQMSERNKEDNYEEIEESYMLI